jgi:hypothetical protein
MPKRYQWLFHVELTLFILWIVLFILVQIPNNQIQAMGIFADIIPLIIIGLGAVSFASLPIGIMGIVKGRNVAARFSRISIYVLSFVNALCGLLQYGLFVWFFVKLFNGEISV